MLQVTRVCGELLILSCIAAISTNSRAQIPAVEVAPTPVVRSEARLVVLDVVVTDARGDPVRGLTLKDFELREDGVPRVLRTVEEHSATITTSPLEPTSVSANSSLDLFSNKPPSEQVWNVLLLDLLNPTWEQQVFAREQLKKFAQELPSDQNVTLVIMGNPSKLAVPFSRGVSGVQEFLANSRPAASGTPSAATTRMADNHVTLEDVFTDNSTTPIKPIPRFGPKTELDMGSDSPEEMASKHRQSVQLLLDTFSSLADWLSHYPGRKNVYWLSAGFPRVVEDSPMPGVPQVGRREGIFGKEQKQMDKLLQNARIAVYPIDITGIHVDRPTFAEWERVSDLQDFAEQTGGVLRRNDNNIAAMLSEEFNHDQDFYTLTYTPSGKNWNGQYRKISLAVRQHSYQLAYRHGYYAIDAPAKAPTEDDFNKALDHGAEQVNDVVFSVHPRKDAANMTLDYSVDPHSLRFAVDADGRHNADVDCAVAEYDASGKWLGTARSHGAIRLTPKQWPGVTQSGLLGRVTAPLAPGVTFFKIGVRDVATGRFGTLEVAFASAPSSR